MAKKPIEHLVVLMMENRSLDHSLGFLKSSTYPIDGLDPTMTNPDSTGALVPVTGDAEYAGDFTPDPGHDFLSVNKQIFGNSQGTGSGPFMQGFVRAYQDKTGDVASSHNIMKCFSPGRLPALTTLATEFAVCDRWFASVPGPTIPNRAFSYGAWSFGRVDMNPNYLKLVTIFERLAQNGVSSKIYYNDWCLGLANGFIEKNARKLLFFFDDFLKDAKKNKLPAFSFIEPRYNDFTNRGQFFPAADQHPDHNVFQGEIVIKAVYDAIRKNQQTWESTLLVITYDEHGGLFDHVTPPATVNPDLNPPATDVFNFERLGVRVPAVLVSPFIKKGTILGTVTKKPNGEDRVFDHTSVIATARKLFIKDFAGSFLTQRDLHADTFEDCLTLDNARSKDEVNIPQPTRTSSLSGAVGLTASDAAPPRARRLSDLVTDHLLASDAPASFAAAGGKASKKVVNTELSTLTTGFSLKAAGIDPSQVSTDPINEFQAAMLHPAALASNGLETEQDAAKYLARVRSKVENSRKAAKGKTPPPPARSQKASLKKPGKKSGTAGKAGKKGR